MCAINGILGVNTQALEIMLEETKHRGPDAVGRFYGAGIALGHNRLSILDPSDRSNQPFLSTDRRYVLVFNGEIYNYRELRKELPKYNFLTDSDTEVLLALLIHKGEAALDLLRGIFSFALWDTEKRQILLARDQMGVKPLYYVLNNGTLYFSSELSALVSGTGLRKMHSNSLTSYLFLNYTLAPETLVEGIKKLRPGHLIRYSEGQLVLEQQRYWHCSDSHIHTPSHENIRETIDRVVTRQLISDRPVGITLSGGLDSSIVLHHACRQLPELQTFSSAFETTTQIGQKYNEDAELAKRTALHYGVDHTIFTIPTQEVRDNLDIILGQQSDPIANPTGVTRYLLYKRIRESGIVVVLGGDGGDELFGGYSRYQRLLAAQIFQKMPTYFRSKLAIVSRHAADLNLAFGAAMHLRLMAHPSKDVFRMLRNKNIVQRSDLESSFNEIYENIGEIADPVAKFMLVDRETWLAEESLLQTDINSMRHALEARVPLLDTTLVQLADSIQTYKRVSLRTSKKILRDVYKSHLPAFLFDQPKRGWQSPGAKWLRDPVIEKYAREVLSPHYYGGLNEVIDWDVVQTMYNEHLDGKVYYLYPLWNMLQIQVWARKNKIIL